MPEEHAWAAAAGAGSSHSAGVAESGAAASTDSQFVHEIDTPSDSTFSKSTRPQIPSDDPVLAELEQTELESDQPHSPGTESQANEAKKQGSVPVRVSALPPSSKSNVSASSSHKSANKTRGPLVAVLMLAVACGGFYAAWTYQPGFQTIVQPQIDRVLGLVGIAPAAKPPAKPATPPAPTRAPLAKADINPSQSASPVSANSAASPVAETQAAPTSPTSNPAVQSASAASATLGSKPSAVPQTTATAIKPAEGKPAVVNPAGPKIDAASALTNTPLSDEKTAIILSSKGAESRLSYNPPPKYPAGARTGSAEGTVVLKAIVDDKGKVEGLRLVEGNAALAPAAFEAVKQWRYRPYLRDGKAQPFQTVVIVDFSH
jgi:protein TonB